MIKVKIRWASEGKKDQEKEFHSIEDMLNYGLELYHRVIIDNKTFDKQDYTMTIYDGYME